MGMAIEAALRHDAAEGGRRRQTLTLAASLRRSRSSSVMGLASPKGLLLVEETAGPPAASMGTDLKRGLGGRMKTKDNIS
jgi:hypothetical protein